MQYPEEESIRKAIERECGDTISLAKRALNSWTTIQRSHGYRRSSLPPEVKNAAYVLDIRACRQFRSVIELCMRGEAHDASILARTMFENLLALEFVLKPRISLKPYRKRYKHDAPSSMPRLLRARLYLTYYGFQWEAFRSRHGSKPGVRRHARRLASCVPEQILKNYESLIGSIWVERFTKRARTYSGLTVAELSQAIGPVYARWYNVVYAIQSGAVHASNAAELLHFNNAIWHDAPDDIEVALTPAINIFFAGAESLHKHIGFGSAVGMLLSGLDAEWGRIRDARRNRRT
ncbi:MAG TPA: DUF5677 domain-containing protein [Thermoguttaceae bacterium]|nr:DUF5677 domain-containing protein [Thermoguttaceae bacterium]